MQIKVMRPPPVAGLVWRDESDLSQLGPYGICLEGTFANLTEVPRDGEEMNNE